MNITPELAEVLGIFAADGSMQDNHICMWGNLKEDREYYDKIVCPLFSGIFGKKIIAHEKKSNSVYGFYICNKSAVNFMKNFGFCKRKTYTVKIPEVILKNEDSTILAAFVRGFSDCDGYLSFMKRKGKYKEFKRKFHTYPRIGIKITSKEMIKELSEILKKLGINHTVNTSIPKKSNLAEVHIIEIRGIPRVEDYISKIGFNNPAQYSKYEVWKKFGFCPSNSSREERQLILSDKLNPFSFYAPDRI